MNRRVLAACGGFLLAVLWFDLMFDVQVLGLGESPLPEPVLASIAFYYHRVTTEAFPMNRLIAVVMLLAVGGSLYQLVRRRVGIARGLAALALCALPTALALFRIVPAAIRLGGRADSLEIQSELARQILYGHLLCIGSIALFIALQLSGSEPRRAIA